MLIFNSSFPLEDYIPQMSITSEKPKKKNMCEKNAFTTFITERLKQINYANNNRST